ncbi:hypothetical protein [Halobacillus andaensis]|uniref:hypothetical protein n=1 Tax=Halobacillus andaensis TaxID=1176239 RepID=UPI003D7030B3
MTDILVTLLVGIVPAVLTYFGTMYQSKNQLKAAQEQHKTELDKIKAQHEAELEKMKQQIELQLKAEEQSAYTELSKSAFSTMMDTPEMKKMLSSLMIDGFKQAK